MEQISQVTIDISAWSHGQVSAKLWLIEELEKRCHTSYKQSIVLYGGWYAITAFLLLSRNNLNIERVQSFDIDPDCEYIANKINTTWLFDNGKFEAFTKDCNSMRWDNVEQSIIPSIIINTSTEHFASDEWFDNIPSSTIVALQGNNQIHDGAYNGINSLYEMKSRFPLFKTIYSGQRKFQYPDKEYTRFMLIGQK